MTEIVKENDDLTQSIRLPEDGCVKSRLMFFLLLTLALLFAQQGAVLHALGHFAENHPAQQEKHLPHSPACDKCVVYAGIGSAAVSAVPLIAKMEATALYAVVLLAALFLAPSRFYSSRAPPRLA